MEPQICRTAKQPNERSRRWAFTASDAARGDAPVPPRPWYLSTMGLALSGSLLMWAALPPLDWGPLGWFAPVCWLALVRRRRLDGRRPYLNIFAAGLVFWLAALYWLTLPHWSASFGWVGLSIYLACYVALFVGLGRIAVHRCHVPLMISAPVIWTGLEWVRAHLFTGFLMASLAHTQYRWIAIIQLSDLAGAYGVSFLVMFVAACVARMLPIERHRPAVWPLAPLVLAMSAALGYGQWRMAAATTRPGPKVALIQGNIDTDFESDPKERRRQIRRDYLALSREALHANPRVDLVVWPESMYWAPLVLIDQGAYLPAAMFASSDDVTPEEARRCAEGHCLPEAVRKFRRECQHELYWTVDVLGRAERRPAQSEYTPTEIAADEKAADQDADAYSSNAGSPLPPQPLGPALMLGMDTEKFEHGLIRRYSTSLLLNRNGRIADYYHKMHPVIFGEYVPLGDVFPWLYSFTPLAGGLSIGDGPKAFEIAGTRVAPSICYESVMPHLIRDQVAALRRQGREPDLLVTQSNDGWFWGSSALDMHMICSVFRAVECRKPVLIAANTGISAVIDANGKILQRGPRHAAKYLIADVRLDSRRSLYVQYGDTLGIACGLGCGLLLLWGLVERWGRRKPAAAAIPVAVGA